MCDDEFNLNIHAYYFQFAFFAAYSGLMLFFLRWDGASRLGIVVLTLALCLNAFAFSTSYSHYQTLNSVRDEAFSSELHQQFNAIPPGAGVYSPHRYSAYLSNRENMVMGDLIDENLDFDAKIEALYPLTNVHAGEIDYIVCDLVNDQPGWRRVNYNTKKTDLRVANVNKLLHSGQWQSVWNQNNVVILKRVRSGVPAPKL